MLIIGLTGSIGMGKTTLASQLEALGAKICSADWIVHHILFKDKKLLRQLAALFPKAVTAKGVDRAALGAIVFHDQAKRQQLEALLHPLVIAEENKFIRRARALGAPIVVLDIPLLFETGGQARCDFTVVASAPHFLQKQRVMKRPGMTEKKFAAIMATQMPDHHKRKRADAVVKTGLGKAHSFRKIRQLLKEHHAA